MLGKQTRVAASIASDDNPTSHYLALDTRAEGIQFREKLAMRETARRAFVSADNDQALRRALLRRSCPHRGRYQPGEWVMVWRPTLGGSSGGVWQGPMKVIVQEDDRVIWVSMLSRLFRVAPERVRPVTSIESRLLPNRYGDGPESTADVIRPGQGVTQLHDETETIPMPAISIHSDTRTSTGVETPSHGPERQPTIEQPDSEPTVLEPQEVSGTSEPPSTSQADAVNVPVPEDTELQCVGLLCIDQDDDFCRAAPQQYKWEMTVDLTPADLEHWKNSESVTDLAFLAASAKKQRSEVRLHELSPADRERFEQAKASEVANWLKTGSVKPLLREKVSEDEIIRCRWLLVWKPLDPTDLKPGDRTHKAKARLVILGFQDPQIEELIRDSPTLGKVPRMMLLQLVSSMQWTLRSFDIKAAFLQGETEGARRIAVEPVPELAKAMGLKANQLCQLTKGAYGLMDAPYLWYRTLTKELIRLGFVASPFDPCLFVLRHPNSGELCGVLGIHVDDGLGGGNEYYAQQVAKLESKFPFGSKKTQQFTYTGIELTQHPDFSISMSQSKYIKNIPAITIATERRLQEEERINDADLRDLRALIGSLQYAAVNTRPDISCKLSMLQTEVRQARVRTLIDANKLLHEAKRHHSVSIQIKPIPVNQMRSIAFSDASFSSVRNPDSRAGSIVLATHENIMKGDTCPVSALCWGSKKIQRVVTSTLAAETMALDSTMDQLSWIRLVWGWFMNPKCDWRKPEQTLQHLPEAVTTVSLREIMDCAMAKGVNLTDSITATDCKSLYDLISRTATPSCQEFRTSLHARAIKEMMEEGTILRWVHSGAQLADALTKAMNGEFLRATLLQGTYQLHDAGEILKQRANARSRLQWLKAQHRES